LIFGLAAVTASIFGLYRSYYYTFQRMQAIEEARNGVEIMIKQIREARQGDDGAYIIEKADDYEFIFYSDIDKDNSTERVRYFIDGSDFKKGIINPSGAPLIYATSSENISILSKYVRNQPPIFHYFDGSGNELPAPARLQDTKAMKVYLVINVAPSELSQDFVLESEVQLRNLKTNL
jgi:hypothetical protein